MSANTADAQRGGFAAGAASRGRLVARLVLPGFPQRESSSCLDMDDRVRHSGVQRSAKFETYARGLTHRNALFFVIVVNHIMLINQS